MRTTFTLHQLADPAIAEADAILRSCEHYGFCTAGCPTYVLLGDENDAPRGRIDLIREMLEAGGAPSPKTVQHIDRCLSCLSCMTTCAIKVDYRHLVDRARVHIERHHRRTWDERLVRGLLTAVLPSPRRFRAVLRLAPLARHAVELAPRKLADRLRPVLDMATRAPLPAEEPPLAGHHPTTLAPRRGRVLLLAGCAQRALAPSINAATVRMLHRAGFDVTVPPEAGCCGSLELHLGAEARAQARARRNVRVWTRELAREGDGEDVAAIVVNASGCGSTVKDYGHLLQRDDPAHAQAAARIGSLARDVCEFLASVDLPPPPAPRRHVVAMHDPCSLRNVQRITDAPRTLLARAGFELREIAEAHFCCGSAGTYNLLEPDIARRLGERKAAHIAGTGAQLVAAANIGCVVQIGRHAALPVVHPVELLDWAWGGPRPAALEGVALAELPVPPPMADGPAEMPPSAPPPDDPDAAGFW